MAPKSKHVPARSPASKQKGKHLRSFRKGSDTTSKTTARTIAKQNAPSPKTWESAVGRYLKDLKNYWWGTGLSNKGITDDDSEKCLLPPRRTMHPGKMRDIVRKTIGYGITHGVVERRGSNFKMAASSNTLSEECTTETMSDPSTTSSLEEAKGDLPESYSGCNSESPSESSSQTPPWQTLTTNELAALECVKAMRNGVSRYRSPAQSPPRDSPTSISRAAKNAKKKKTFWHSGYE